MSVRIVIADRYPVVLEGIKAFLAVNFDLEVVGEATNGSGVVETARDLKPDIIITDTFAPDLDPLELVARLRKNSPRSQIVIFTTRAVDIPVPDLLASGISAHVLKEGPLSELACAIRTLAEGGNYYSAVRSPGQSTHRKKIEDCIGYEIGFHSLSRREREVLPPLAEGRTVKDIAHDLGISPKTVDHHKRRIMLKLEAKTTVDLTRIAVRRKLIAL